MKKNLFMVAAVALMALVSCNKEEINNNVVEQPQEPSYYVEFVASIADDADTKAFDAELKKTYWVEGEAISINGKKFEVKEVLENGNAIFENKEELGSGFGAPYNAVYPYSSGTSFDAVTVPSEQTAMANNVAPEALVAVAQSDNNTLEFKHLTSLLKFQVPAACSEVTISSDNALSGSVKVTSVSDKDVAYSDASASKTLKITGSFVTGKDYYLSVLPGTKANFVVRIDGYLSKNAESVKISRSTIANMKTLPSAVSSGWELYVSDVLGVKFYNDLNNNLVAKKVSLKSSSKFKFHKGNDWVRTIATSPSVGNWHKVYKGNDDLSGVAEATYDIYINTVNDVVCLVKTGDSIPAYDNAHKQYHILIEGNDWTGLYTWSPSELYGSFNDCLSNRTGTVTIKKDGNNDQQFSYWVIKTTETGKVFNFLFRKSNAQSGDIKNVTLNGDIPCYSNNGYNGTYSLTTYDIK